MQKFKICMLLVFFSFFLLNAIGFFAVITTDQSTLSNILFYNHVFATKEFYIFIFISLILCFLLPILSPLHASVLSIGCMVVLYFSSVDFALLSYEYSLMTALSLYIFNILISYFMETHNKQKIINVFGQYIPPEIVEKINKSPGDISMESETKEMSVLFCDLHNFTSFSERLSPKKVSELLNIYFTEVSECLHSSSATIDKFIGDAVMAFWGAPMQQNNHTELAINASFKIHATIKKLIPLFAKNGWSTAQVGIGMCSGDMHVGNMGSKYRVTYTVIGDTVNLASRLESLTRFYNVPTIFSEPTIAKTDNVLFRELDMTVIRGKVLPARIFQPICFVDQATTEIKNELEQQQNALQIYYKKQYKVAAEMFGQLAKDYPADPYYKVMQKKIITSSNTVEYAWRNSRN